MNLQLIKEFISKFLNDTDNIFLLFDDDNDRGMKTVLDCCERILCRVMEINDKFYGLQQMDAGTLNADSEDDILLLKDSYDYMRMFNQLIANIYSEGTYSRAFFYLEHILHVTCDFENQLIKYQTPTEYPVE